MLCFVSFLQQTTGRIKITCRFHFTGFHKFNLTLYTNYTYLTSNRWKVKKRHDKKHTKTGNNFTSRLYFMVVIYILNFQHSTILPSTVFYQGLVIQKTIFSASRIASYRLFSTYKEIIMFSNSSNQLSTKQFFKVRNEDDSTN